MKLSANKSKDIIEKKVPKHLKNNKDFTKQQALKKDHQKTNMKLISVLVVFSLIFGAGLFVYNLDDVYLEDKSDITMSFSNNFRSGGEAPLVVTVSDFDGEPVVNKEVKIELEYEVENKTKQLVLSNTKKDARDNW